MNLDDFRALYAYNDWANERLTSMLRAAFGEETDLRAAGSVLGAIQETAAHIFAAQATWRQRIEGVAPKDPLDPAEYPTSLSLRFAFGAERARFWGLLEALASDPDALSRPISYTTSQGAAYTQPLWQILQHVVTHSMYHRGQITARLLDLGHESALLSTDLITFYRDAQS